MSSNLRLNDLSNRVHQLLSDTEPSINSSLEILRGITQEWSVFQKTVHDVLLNSIQTQRNTLASLGNAWLTAGAQGYVIEDESQLVFCWSNSSPSVIEHSLHSITLWSALHVEGRKIGKVGILGLHDQVSQQRLEAETLLLSLLFSLKMDLDAVRAELQSHQRLKNDMAVAANIQLQLLQQKIPHVQGLDLYARSMPALQVGGDFYNFNVHKLGSLVFSVGDVSGKGLPAAMLMAMTRVVLHGAARFMPTVNPKILLSRINEDLYDDFTELGMFATTFVGCYDPPSHQLTYANAGHSPVIYCPHGGPAVLLEADGPAVGVLSFNLCENISMDFFPGDVLVVATDGFSEASNGECELFGYERLLHSVEQLASLSAEQIAMKMFHHILRFSEGQEQSDDQTIVVLKGVDI